MKFWWKSLLAGALAVSTLATSVFAAETVKINGYQHYEVGYGAITAEYQISLSNVVKEEGTDTGYAVGTYYCQGSTEVVALDQLDAFGVSKAAKVPDGDYYLETEFLVPDGYTTEEWETLYYEEDRPVPKGTKYTLGPGVYYAYGNYGPLDGGINVLVMVEAGEGQVQSQPATNQIQAIYNSATVSLNGQPMEFEAYNINGNNYFKLRDVAIALASTPQCFDVAWDQEKQVINLVSGQTYSRAQTDTIAKGDGQNKTATAYESGILLNGNPAALEAYTINNNNFFKLRDLCVLFGVEVQWDAAKNQITLIAK